MPSPTRTTYELTDPHFRGQVERAKANPHLPEIARKWRSGGCLVGSSERVAIEELESEAAGVTGPAALLAYCENVLNPRFGRGSAKAKQVAA